MLGGARPRESAGEVLAYPSGTTEESFDLLARLGLSEHSTREPMEAS